MAVHRARDKIVNETVWQAILDRELNDDVVGQGEDEDLDLVAGETDEEIIGR